MICSAVIYTVADHWSLPSLFLLIEHLPVFDPEGETFTCVEKILPKGVVSDEVEVRGVVEVTPPKVLLAENHGYTQVLNGTD